MLGVVFADCVFASVRGQQSCAFADDVYGFKHSGLPHGMNLFRQRDVSDSRRELLMQVVQKLQFALA